MDAYEATKVVMSRIQGLDPENASKIMGYILIQDQGEKEMIRLAFGPEALLQSCISQAKTCLGLSNSASASGSPSSNPSTPQRPRILVPSNGFHLGSNPSSPFQRNSSPRPFSYAAALNGGGSQVQDHLPFLDDSMADPLMSPGGRSDSLVFPSGEDVNGVQSPHPFHRRSCSVNDAAAFMSGLEDGGGLGWRPCMYFARGFCKNGSSCKFLHSEGEAAMEMGSDKNNVTGFHDLLRLKALHHHHRLAFMASATQHPFNYHKNVDFLTENHRNELAAAALVGGPNSISRQIYLTFPADSTFKEDDVSNYFSKFGPVQDVRIPYQQKRMFGFVTFVDPETVKLILAKGNPHFVCDSRVLVKPYKEKGKILDKKQLLERGENSACLSPSAIDSRKHVDSHFGDRMLFNAQEMLLRRKLEEAELQHAIGLQGQKILNLQLMDLKNQHHNHHILPRLRPCIPISSPRNLQSPRNLNFITAHNSINQEESEEFDSAVNSPVIADDQKLVTGGTKSPAESGSKLQNVINSNYDSNFPESLEHILPDNLFASPTKSAAERHSFSQAPVNAALPETIPSPNHNNPVLPSGSPISISPLKSCYLQMPARFSSGQEAIEM